MKQRLYTFINEIWHLFLNGLFTILPLTLTIAVFKFSFSMLVSWLEPIKHLEPEIIRGFPYAEVIIVLLFILLLGVLLRTLILGPVIHYFEALILKIPLIKPVYSGIKQIISAYSITDKTTFKQIVMIEFPRTGMYSIGFVTSELPAELSPDQTKKYFNVFVPTTPNPTTGFLLILTQDQIINVDINRQEAMAMIISGGIIQPDRFTTR
jgi:uncharacterized membrane protein